MHEDAPPFTAGHVRASTLLATAQLNYLLDEAEHQTQHDNQPGLDAISTALNAPLALLSSVAQPLEGFDAQIASPAREEARQATQLELDRTKQRIAASTLSRNQQNTTDSDDPSTYLISAVMTILSSRAATRYWCSLKWGIKNSDDARALLSI